MKALSYILILMFVVSCTEDNFVKNYASDLEMASRPGINVKKFLEKSKGLPPDYRLLFHYEYILENWKYKNDPANKDIIKPAEICLKENILSGDCEDKASLLAAIARYLNIDCHIILGKQRNDKEENGHAWTEIVVTTNEKVNKKFISKMVRNFGNIAFFTKRNNALTLHLNPPNTLNNYMPEYLVDVSTGEIKKIISN